MNISTILIGAVSAFSMIAGFSMLSGRMVAPHTIRWPHAFRFSGWILAFTALGGAVSQFLPLTVVLMLGLELLAFVGFGAWTFKGMALVNGELVGARRGAYVGAVTFVLALCAAAALFGLGLFNTYFRHGA